MADRKSSVGFMKDQQLNDLQSDLRGLRMEATKSRSSFEGNRRRSSAASGRGTIVKNARRKSSARVATRLELVKAHVYEKNTFMGTTVRNPITGQVRLEGIEDWLDFAFVDLWTRPSLTGSPEQLIKDRYMFKPKALVNRSWIYHGMYFEDQTKDFESEEKEKDHVPAIKRALAASCIDSNISGGRWSSVMVLAPQLFPIVLAGEITLMIVCLVTFLFCLFVAVQTNHHVWYRAQRLVTLPMRLIFLMTLFNSVSVPDLLNQGKVINVLGYIIAVMMTIVDFTMGDAAVVLCRQMESTYEIVQELPHNVWVCRLSNGQPPATNDVQAKRERGVIDKGICGVPNWDECLDLALIADVHGLIVELVKPRKEEWTAFLRIYQQTANPVKYMAQDSFNVMKQTLEDIEDPTRRLKNRALNATYLVMLNDGRLVTRSEVDAGHVMVEDFEDGEEE